MKGVILVCMAVGTYAGSYIPVLWGDNFLSISSILFGALGGALGIWAGYAFAVRNGME